MKVKSNLFFVVLCILALASCSDDQVSLSDSLDLELKRLLQINASTNNAHYYEMPVIADYNNINASELDKVPQDPKNLLTPEKVKLGQMLFYESGFARNAVHEEGMETFSCATCHLPNVAFMPGLAQGVADGGMGVGVAGEGRFKNDVYEDNELDVQESRPLSLIGSAYVEVAQWNGKFGATSVNSNTKGIWGADGETHLNFKGFSGLETTNFSGLELHRFVYNKELVEDLNYREMFDAAFQDYEGDERYSNETAALALSAYIRTLLPTEAPFQKWLRSNYDAMSDAEKRGAILFFDKARCSQCHNMPHLGSMEFHALGVKDLYETESFDTSPNDKRNFGRGGFTEKDSDMFRFKVPQLYNLKEAPFLFHGSSKHSLAEVVDYKIEAETENPMVSQDMLSNKFLKLNLSESERTDLLEFLEHGLYDDNMYRYVPEEVLSGGCFPNNDLISQAQLGCQ